MNKAQAIAANKAKGESVKNLRQSLGEQEFSERYVGDYKGHIKKLRSIFNSTEFGCKFYNQVGMGSSLMMQLSKQTK